MNWMLILKTALKISCLFCADATIPSSQPFSETILHWGRSDDVDVPVVYVPVLFFTGLLLIFLILEMWQHVRCTDTSCCSSSSSFDLFVVDIFC